MKKYQLTLNNCFVYLVYTSLLTLKQLNMQVFTPPPTRKYPNYIWIKSQFSAFGITHPFLFALIAMILSCPPSRINAQTMSIDPVGTNGVHITEACTNTGFQLVISSLPSNMQYLSHTWSGADWALRPPLFQSTCAGSRGNVNASIWNVSWTDYWSAETDQVTARVKFFDSSSGEEVEIPVTRTVRIRRIRNFSIQGSASIQNCCFEPVSYAPVGHRDGGENTGYSFNWSVPPNWTILGASNQETITVIPNATGGGTVSLTISRPNNINKTESRVISRFVPQFTINTSNVPTTVCPGDTLSFSTTLPQCGVPSINWTVPSGWTIISGQGTSTVTITPTPAAIDGSILVNGTLPLGNCTISGDQRSLIFLNEAPSAPQFLVLGSNDVSQINWINRRWNVCPGGISTVIEVIPTVLDQSYTFSVSAPWQINGQSGPITTSDPWVFVSGPSNAPSTGVLSAQASNCIGQSSITNYTFARNNGNIPCGDGGGGVKARLIGDDLVISPNPVYNLFEIRTADDAIQQVKIISIDGKVMQFIPELQPNSSFMISSHSWQPGLYVVQYWNNDQQIISKKLLKH